MYKPTMAIYYGYSLMNNELAKIGCTQSITNN